MHKNLLLSVILLLLTACQTSESVTEPQASPTPRESRLSLANAILEQANPEGQTLWKIKSVTTDYSPDRQHASLQGVEGNFFSNGEMIIYLKADSGEVIKDGETIILEGNVVATDIRNGTVIRSDRLEWYPEENLLLLEGNPSGEHPQFRVFAQQAKYYSDLQKLELLGDIQGYQDKTALQFRADQLEWHLATATVWVTSPLEIVRYNEAEVVIERVTAESLEVNLEAKQAKFRQNVELVSLDPPVQIASNAITWYYQQRLVEADEPVKIIHEREKLMVSGNRGQVDLESEIAHLHHGVSGKRAENQSKLYAEELTWSLPTQIVEAKGNVIYEQVDPLVYLTGDKAVGKLESNQIIVTSDQEQVVTELNLD